MTTPYRRKADFDSELIIWSKSRDPFTTLHHVLSQAIFFWTFQGGNTNIWSKSFKKISLAKRPRLYAPLPPSPKSIVKDKSELQLELKLSFYSI